ncbi:helix-turn-helix domain-containing protein [Paenibacillus sp. HW567]|uniref:helix-turn-helix domain-containing protein n=1 Tax=Paenibacillus sp. HW567 TaxID=1034769 RepID=UPI00036092A8|nr:helix-turn-helix domain-containing protein [Paenibacillus sp. HW567]
MEVTHKENATVVLSVADIQRMMGIGRRQAYELMHSGQFHVVRVGQRILVSEAVFLNWLNQPVS